MTDTPRLSPEAQAALERARERLAEKIKAQDAERGRPLTNLERLANLKAAIARCDQCDNGIEPNWNYCAWCGWHLDDERSAYDSSGLAR